MVAIESAVVQAQIRSKQFSADIIDSIVGRLGQVVIPMPKDKDSCLCLEDRAKRAFLGRVEAREMLSHVICSLDGWLSSQKTLDLAELLAWRPRESEYVGKPAFLNSRRGFLAFLQKTIESDILIPKYYDPTIPDSVPSYSGRCEMKSIGELVEEGIISIATGDEIGHINYGTGEISFVRTSDFGSWELKRIPKHGVDRSTYELWRDRHDVKAGDIFIVRDGTYLVGTSVMLMGSDLPLLYCGGIIKVRCLRKDILPPTLLFALLNLPFALRQMRNKQFTRDVIDTLGKRLLEVILPIPRNTLSRKNIAETIGGLLDHRSRLRVELGELINTVYPVQPTTGKAADAEGRALLGK